MTPRLRLTAGSYLTDEKRLVYIVRRRINDLHVEECGERHVDDMPLTIWQPKDFKGWRNIDPLEEAA